jgi:hypothetical protein
MIAMVFVADVGNDAEVDGARDKEVAMSASWYFCLKHMRVEPEVGCPNKLRLGPYPTEEDAANALHTVAERNKAWDAQDD